MNLNSYILKDYLHLSIQQASLKSNLLERPLQSVTFYRQDTTPLDDGSLAIIITSDDLKNILSCQETGCFLCPASDDIKPEHCKADIILLDKNISVFEIYEDLRRIFLEFEQLDQQMNRLIRQEAALNLFGNAILKFLWNPVSLYSDDMRLLFYSERKKPRQYQIYSEGELNQYLPDEEIEDLKIDKLELFMEQYLN